MRFPIPPRPLRRALLVLAGAALSTAAPPATALAQMSAPAADSLRDSRGFSFTARGPYRSAVPRVDSLLGFSLGDRNTQFAEQERTLLAIANAARDRVAVEQFGVTNEGRPMRLFIVSAPENIARLDSIRADLDRLADPRARDAATLRAVAERVPAVVWVNSSIHGNESPGFETAMPLLYQLAASEEPATLDMLRNTIVLISPSANPDGHERFAVWYNSVAVGSPNPGAMEHDEPWSIQGRYNHYRFDMNRDAIATTQRESQATMHAMLRWHPMVSMDLHGQTEQYYFPPAARPVNVNVGARSDYWRTLFGRSNAAAFDSRGWLYFVRNEYDLYGPFYWDSWPSLTGATGMTYETDGGGWKGTLWRREDGSLLSFRDGIAKHFVASLATIQATAANRASRVGDYLAFRQSASTPSAGEPLRRVILAAGDDPVRAGALAAALLRSGIEVRYVSTPLTVPRARSYTASAAPATRRIAGGAYVVDLAQPQGRVARAILEPDAELDSVFAREQIARFQRNQRRGRAAEPESYEFYDVTAWSLPLAFGVDAVWTDDTAPVGGELLRAADAGAVRADTGSAAVRTAGEVLPVPVPGGIQGADSARTGYIFAPGTTGAPRLAYGLMREGFRVAVATMPVEAAGRQWPRGTFVVRTTRNGPSLPARLDSLARSSGVVVTPLQTAFTDSGQFGVGSTTTAPLVAPRVALVGDEGIAQTSYGALWWSLERRYGMRLTPIPLGYITGGDLSEFNVIILPDASPGALAARLGEGGTNRLRDWVRRGGTLVTMAGSAAWATRDGVRLTTARLVGADAAGSDAAAPPDSAKSADSAAGARKRPPLPGSAPAEMPVLSPSARPDAPAPVPGSAFTASLDRSAWLAYGYTSPSITALVEGDNFLTLSKEGVNAAVFPTSGPLRLAGFVFPGNTERLLRGTALAIDEPTGQGHVVLFANQPMFRGWWRTMDTMLLNAILLGPAL